MANRYRNRNYGRGGYGSGTSDYGQNRYGSEYGGYSTDYDREENYSGDRGQQQYRQQSRRDTRASERGRGYSSRDYDENYTTGAYRDERRFRGGESDRQSYYGQGSLNEYGGGGTYGGYGERGDYRRGYREYSGNYPESESGFDFERDEERGWLDKASDEVSSWFGDDEAERRRQMDELRSGGYRGRGPRNYTRSDERIREDINDLLTDSDYLDASDIEVEVTSGEVILTGTVENRYAKRLAEDIAEDVSGVKNVENRLRVNQSFYGQGSGSSYTNPTANTGSGSTMGMPDRVTGSTGTTSTGTTETSSSTDTTTGQSRGKTA